LLRTIWNGTVSRQYGTEVYEFKGLPVSGQHGMEQFMDYKDSLFQEHRMEHFMNSECTLFQDSMEWNYSRTIGAPCFSQ
jgi:hypothetical protein